MRKNFYLPILAFALATMACQEKKQEQGIGIQEANLDKTVAPSADFYQYACGGWMKANPLSDEYGRYGSFDKLAENNQKQLKGNSLTNL